jgi:hypothetical protein
MKYKRIAVDTSKSVFTLHGIDAEEHLAGTVTGIVAKRFEGGPSWCSDPIIRAEAIAYLPRNLEIRPSGI